jgi:hypothetical protein
VALAPLTHTPAVKNTVPGGVATPVDIETETTDVFGSLRVALGAIHAVYANREVRLRSPPLKAFHQRAHLQETTTIRDIIESLLSRIVALGTRFVETSPSDMEELRRRSDLIRYIIAPPFNLVLRSFQQVHSHCSWTAAVC